MDLPHGLGARLRAVGALLAALVVTFVAVSAPVARAAEEKPTVTWTAKLEPAQVGPGGEGVLVITGTIRAHVHVFADGKKFKVLPNKTDGVTWGKPTTTKPTKWVDPMFPEDPPSDVWFDKVEVRVPFTLAADAKLPMTPTVVIKWNCCDEETCYNETATKPPLGVEITAPPAAPEGPGMADSAPVAPSDAPDAAAPAPAAAPEGGHEAPVAPPVAPSPDVPAAPVDAPVAPAPVDAAPPVAAGPAPVSTLANASISTPEAKVGVVATTAAFVVTFEPAEGHHLYPLGSEDGVPVSVEGKPSAGVTWGKASAPPLGAPDIHEAYTVTIPYTDASAGKAALAVAVSWQACLDTGICRQPEAPHRFELRRAADGKLSLEETMDGVPAAPTVVVAPPVAADGAPGAAPKASGPVAASGLLFEVSGRAEEGFIERTWRTSGYLILGILFAIGIGLAFTPCVLPIIPITVSIVGGGNASVSKGRMAFLLTCFVLGLSMAFGTMGLISAKAGASFSAAFQSPVALWVIAGIFTVLAFGMFGVYELQPPAWAQRLQGGAKGGNPVGAFLFGGMSALIASPCTGPVIAGLIVFTAQSGNSLLGFLMFVSLGLGMGAVFFAAGSLNLLMKPGPWMVWVRHFFGALLVGVALYYLRNAGKIDGPALVVGAVVIAALAAVGIRRHLIHREAEDPRVARSTALKVATMTLAFSLLAGVLTGGLLPDRAIADEGSTSLEWAKPTSREALVAEVEKAKRDGIPTVVDFWAKWCTYCKAYDRVIESNPDVLAAFRKVHRVKIDLTDDDRPWEAGIRDGLGVPRDQQPFLVFIDASGRIRRDLDLPEWKKAGSADALRQRLGELLPEMKVGRADR